MKIKQYMLTSNEILQKVNEFIEHLPYDRKPQGLYEPIKYVLSLQTYTSSPHVAEL